LCLVWVELNWQKNRLICECECWKHFYCCCGKRKWSDTFKKKTECIIVEKFLMKFKFIKLPKVVKLRLIPSRVTLWSKFPKCPYASLEIFWIGEKFIFHNQSSFIIVSTVSLWLIVIRRRRNILETINPLNSKFFLTTFNACRTL
jgi:hypothetical protein